MATPKITPPWPSRDAELIEHHSRELTHAQIAVKMNLPVPAVSGRIGRLGKAGLLKAPIAHRKNSVNAGRPPSISYTPEQDAAITRMRSANVPWDKIAIALGWHPTRGAAIRRHAQAVKLDITPPPVPEPEKGDERNQAGWKPLLQYHSLSWGVLMELTPIIAGEMATKKTPEMGWMGQPLK